MITRYKYYGRIVPQAGSKEFYFWEAERNAELSTREETIEILQLYHNAGVRMEERLEIDEDVLAELYLMNAHIGRGESQFEDFVKDYLGETVK